MKLLKTIIILLFPCSSLANSISLNPNDLPLFYTIVGENPRYRTAAFKAQEAFLIQSGITPTYNRINSYVSDKATNTVTYAIDSGTPLRSKDVYFVVGAIYAVGVKKRVTKSFRNPWLPHVSHTIDISEQSQSVNVQISF